jgi:hypothetical protein
MQGDTTKDAFLKMLAKEKEWSEYTNEPSLFIKYKRYQVLDTNKHFDKMEDENVIHKYLKEKNLSKNCCGVFVLHGNQFQFLCPDDIEYEY